ncbi:hypothetical protein PVT71_02340 [Salipiger sp. H15]|uniref:Uncharacterized protein n=1 Tax=Alloyangia sp. H15 TaxID=3029062 RepID=A0AAU8AHS9_9RHOB
MSETNLDFDPLLSEIFQALRCCAPAIECLHAAQEFMPEADARRMDELAGRIASERIFEPRDRGLFGTVLEALNEQIEERTFLALEEKEFGEPDWHRDYTPEGLQLSQHRRCIFALKEHLDRIAALRRAEVLALQFRSADAR